MYSSPWSYIKGRNYILHDPVHPRQSFPAMNHNERRKAISQNIPAFLAGLLLVAGVSFASGCTRSESSQFDALASRFSFAADNLEAQKEETLVALQDASEAQQVAVMQASFNFRSPETLAFIQKWEFAGNQVAQLRVEISNTVASCYEMLDGLRARAGAINDEVIRTETIDYVDRRRLEFDEVVQQTSLAVDKMEAAMLLGDDIIESLRIVGTANLVSEKIDELRLKQQEAIESFAEVEMIIQEGKKFLNIEFGDEIFI